MIFELVFQSRKLSFRYAKEKNENYSHSCVLTPRSCTRVDRILSLNRGIRGLDFVQRLLCYRYTNPLTRGASRSDGRDINPKRFLASSGVPVSGCVAAVVRDAIWDGKRSGPHTRVPMFSGWDFRCVLTRWTYRLSSIRPS